MSPEDEAAIAAAMREARERARGYADFFGWAPNRDLEEQGVVTSLAETLAMEERLFFSQIHRRGRGNDPPDLEALDREGRRLAIEVTEVVDGRAIESRKAASANQPGTPRCNLRRRWWQGKGLMGDDGKRLVMAS